MKGWRKTSKLDEDQSGPFFLFATLDLKGELKGRNWKLIGHFLVKRLL